MRITEWECAIFKLEIEEEAKIFLKKQLILILTIQKVLQIMDLYCKKLRNYSLASVQFEKALRIDPNNDEALAKS